MFSDAVKQYGFIIVQLLHASGMGYGTIAIEAGLSHSTVVDISKKQSHTLSIATIKRLEALALEVAEKERK